MRQVEHLLTENERITAKEGGQGGLTEGQQAQLVRNDKAITDVRLQASRRPRQSYGITVTSCVLVVIARHLGWVILDSP